MATHYPLVTDGTFPNLTALKQLPIGDRLIGYIHEDDVAANEIVIGAALGYATVAFADDTFLYNDTGVVGTKTVTEVQTLLAIPVLNDATTTLTESWSSTKISTELAALPTVLGDLTDVTISSPADGNALIYDVATLQWIAGNAVDTLDGIGNVNIVGAGDTSFLKRSGLNWVAHSPTLTDMGDYSEPSTPTAGNYMVYGTSSWEPAANPDPFYAGSFYLAADETITGTETIINLSTDRLSSSDYGSTAGELVMPDTGNHKFDVLVNVEKTTTNNDSTATIKVQQLIASVWTDVVGFTHHVDMTAVTKKTISMSMVLIGAIGDRFRVVSVLDAGTDTLLIKSGSSVSMTKAS